MCLREFGSNKIGQRPGNFGNDGKKNLGKCHFEESNNLELVHNIAHTKIRTTYNLINSKGISNHSNKNISINHNNLQKAKYFCCNFQSPKNRKLFMQRG